MKGFSDIEENIILELARHALADADIFDYMAEKLDMSDHAMYLLRERITEVTEGVE